MSTLPHPDLLPLTGAQRGIYDAQSIDPHSPFYVVGEVLRLRGGIDAPALCAAIEATQREAETLRLRVVAPAEGEDAPRQYVSEEIVPAVVRDLRGTPHPERLALARIDAAKTALAEATAGMVDAPLCRYEVLLLDDEHTWVIQLYHHLVVDGYSATLLTRRIAEHYTAAVTGAKPKRYRGVGMAQIVEQDAEYHGSEAAREDRDFFRDLLDPLPDLTERERLNAATGSARTSGATITTTVTLSAGEHEAFQAATRAAGTTWVTCLIALYAAQVWQAEGRPERDACLAMPVMARGSVAQRATPHMAVNVLPLLVPVRAQATLGELAAATEARLKDLRRHQRYRGENLPRDLGAPGAGALLHGMGVNAKIFDVRFRFGEATGVLSNVAGGPPEDWGLVVMPAPDGGLDLGLETDPARVPEPVARRRLSRLRDLLVRVARREDPAGARVAELLGGEAERAGLIDARAGSTPPEGPEGAAATLRGLIESLAGVDQARLITQEGALSGAELHRRVLDAARRLPRGTIGIDVPRGAELVVTVLAALYAGVPFTYLESGAPGARREQILSALGARWVAGRDPWPEPAVSGEFEPPVPPEQPAPSPEDLAYVIFTSGSTGTPKGVQVTRGNLEALLRGHLHGLYRRPPAVVAHTASFAFDAALDQLLWLLAGHCVRLYPEEIATDAEAAVAALRADRVTVFDTTPSLAQALMAAGLGELPDLELLVLGGEALPAPLWDRLATGRLRALNAYGPTEACVDALIAEVTPGRPVIGRPVAGMRAYALDGHRRVVGDFERGRLFLAGPQVARGYLNAGDAEDAAFITATIDPRRGAERLYDTGDLVRWLPGRGYEYLGRADDQVEVNGRRVELGEVEAALRATESVAAAAVTPHGRAGLIGWVVPQPGATLIPGEVRESVAAQLPRALVPGRIEVIPELPTTVSGKADRAALAARVTAVGAAEQGDAPSEEAGAPASSASPAEAALLRACREQAGVEMGLRGDFIAQGGDSISALTVATRLRREGWAIWPKELLSGAPLARVAAGMRRSEAAGEREDASFLAVGALPETPVAARQREAAPDGPAWAGFVQYAEIPGTEGAGAVSPDLLREVAAQLAAAHGALRMILDARSGELIVPRVALAAPEECVGAAAAEDLGAVARTPGLLDPEAGRMFHLVALRAGGVGLVAHHSAVDALSWRTLRAEVQRLLRGGRLDHADDRWRAHVLGSRSRDRRAELPHWARVQRAGAIVAAPLPARAEAACASLDLSPEAAGALGAEPEAKLLAALALSGVAPGGYVGVEGHGRSAVGTAGGAAHTVGWFTVEYPLAVRAPGEGNPVERAADALAAARRARRETPGEGEGYGWLAHGDAAGALHGLGLRRPEVVLNVLPGAAGGFRVADHPRRRLTEALTVNVFVGESRVEYTADPARFDPREVHRRLEAGLAALRAAELGGVGDAPRRALERAHGPLERVLPLSPPQEGLLFHALSAPEGADPYALAMRVDLEAAEEIDLPRLEAAWEGVLDRHPTLRAGFNATATEHPRQFVPRSRPATFRAVDARPLGDAWRDLAEHLLREEENRRVDVAAPPLVRATAVRYAPRRACLIVAGHHLLTDGWSTGIMLRELAGLYGGEELPPAPQPEAFLDWVDGRREPDRRAWRAYLGDNAPRTLLAAPGTEDAAGEEALDVGVAGEADALVAAARAAGATPAELLQVAWAYVLSELTGCEGEVPAEVVCGVTASGRPPQLPEAAEMIGLFATTLPARIAVSGDPVADLRAHHAARAELADHTAVSPADIGAAGLFDTIVVYENAPAPRSQGALRVTATEAVGQTHYPITVVSRPGGDFDVALAFRPGLVDRERARWAARRLGQALRAFLGEPLEPARPPAPAAPAAPRSQGAEGAPAEYEQAAPEQPVPAVPTAPAAPRATAEGIAAAMSTVLGHTVGLDEDFAEAGGHSLLAVRLLGRLQREGIELGMGDILAGGSPRGIAARLGGQPASGPLVAHTVGAPTLWCMPPGDGIHAPWARLARQVPVRLRAVSWAGRIEQDALDQAAQDVAALIRAEQPHGPYLLLGWSFGGVLAHAVAHALGGPGEVSFLGIVDSYPAGVLPAGLSPGHDPTPLVDGLVGLDDHPEVLRELVAENLAASGRLMAGAAPLGWDGSVHLVVGTRGAEASGPAAWDPAAAWAGAGARVVSLEVDEDHFGLVKDAGWRIVGPFFAQAIATIQEEEHDH
ncbi:condensation domain-containing protein [Corynebacterium mastitidis]|nr:condensation domain-containing protein [Corynebacterium mastitidis]MCH6197172.1 condensation domain-containing protein [Corynebacterium mastitidis]